MKISKYQEAMNVLLELHDNAPDFRKEFPADPSALASANDLMGALRKVIWMLGVITHNYDPQDEVYQ